MMLLPMLNLNTAKYVDDLTFAENNGGDDQGNLQDDL